MQGERSLGHKGWADRHRRCQPAVLTQTARPTRTKQMHENTYPKQLTIPQRALALELGSLLLFSWRLAELNFPALVLEAVFTATENGLQVEHGAFSENDSIEWSLGEMEEDIRATAERLYKIMRRDWKVLTVSIDPVTRFCDQNFFREKPMRHI